MWSILIIYKSAHFHTSESRVFVRTWNKPTTSNNCRLIMTTTCCSTINIKRKDLLSGFSLIFLKPSLFCQRRKVIGKSYMIEKTGLSCWWWEAWRHPISFSEWLSKWKLSAEEKFTVETEFKYETLGLNDALKRMSVTGKI